MNIAFFFIYGNQCVQAKVFELIAENQTWKNGIWYDNTTVKVQLPLYVPWRYKRGVQVQNQSFLTSALDGCKLSASHTVCFTPKNRASICTD
jgi:hypothetical protein